ncbi:hypothetical protein IMCC20628_00888 [Hoeflea sp. IMCC20628]|uniref:hypothetical protein n=1 Tax=Hoeflea sp. IMCC20628 TaxID=1620421 RepID=UPI00063A8F09|nr:hypothetical protein [Hoeflea sp. IMCC20628]AKH99607.1 hypothetical protein IMCC20628_00888 [Hoeflea sp. IMCC20628]
MIVGANSVTLQRTSVERPAPVRAPADVPAQDQASDALARLDNFVESAALSRKAFAEDRLAHLKEQMNTLSLFNLAPGFLVGHTARMAKELESAANDFTASFKTLAGLEQPANPGQAAETSVPKAYYDVLADDAPFIASMSAEDAETAASFMNTAYQLRSVVELMADDSKDSASVRWSADSARDSTARVSDIMARLEGPSAFNKVYW